MITIFFANIEYNSALPPPPPLKKKKNTYAIENPKANYFSMQFFAILLLKEVQ